MKKSEYNRCVISNFILFYTHQNEDEATSEARRMYDLLDSYIEEDHTDGIDGDKEGNITIGTTLKHKPT